MKLITYKNGKNCSLGVLGCDGTVFDFSLAGLNFADMHEFIVKHKKSDLKKLKKISKKSGGLKLKNSSKCPPITPRQDVICLGINYLEHAIESYKFKNIKFDGKREYAVYFSKRVNEATGDFGKIEPHFDLTQKLDYEAELAVIIGKDAKNISADEAENYVFGYTILNDFSARDLQNNHKQWYFGKSLDTFTAIGPCIVTSDEIDTENLVIKCFVNGELRQNSNTLNMIFDKNFVISELSAGMTLKAGSVISMGTPSGVGMGFTPPKFLKSGDKIECEIENIGKLTNFIR